MPISTRDDYSRALDRLVQLLETETGREACSEVAFLESEIAEYMVQQGGVFQSRTTLPQLTEGRRKRLSPLQGRRDVDAAKRMSSVNGEIPH